MVRRVKRLEECKKIFKSAPQIINPRRRLGLGSQAWRGSRSRLQLRVRGGQGPEVRREIFEEACRQALRKRMKTSKTSEKTTEND